jgi:hypothetical protein
MKVGKKKTGSFYIFGYLLELIIKIWLETSFFSKILAEFGPFFSMENPLYRLKSKISGQN